LRKIAEEKRRIFELQEKMRSLKMSLEELQRKKSKTCTDYDTEERRLMDMLQ